MNYENFIDAVEGLALMYQRTNPNVRVSINRTDNGLELTCAPKEQKRKRWIDEMLEEFNRDYAVNSKIILCDKNRKVLVAKFKYDRFGACHGYGIARCSADDEFDKEVGLAVAFAHFRGYQIPDFV